MAQKIALAEIMARRTYATPGQMRRLAAAYKFQFYRTAVRCRNGHASPRRTATGECSSLRTSTSTYCHTMSGTH